MVPGYYRYLSMDGNKVSTLLLASFIAVIRSISQGLAQHQLGTPFSPSNTAANIEHRLDIIAGEVKCGAMEWITSSNL